MAFSSISSVSNWKYWAEKTSHFELTKKRLRYWVSAYDKCLAIGENDGTSLSVACSLVPKWSTALQVLNQVPEGCVHTWIRFHELKSNWSNRRAAVSLLILKPPLIYKRQSIVMVVRWAFSSSRHWNTLLKGFEGNKWFAFEGNLIKSKGKCNVV